jgi:hypothetical protein
VAQLTNEAAAAKQKANQEKTRSAIVVVLIVGVFAYFAWSHYLASEQPVWFLRGEMPLLCISPALPPTGILSNKCSRQDWLIELAALKPAVLTKGCILAALYPDG